MVKDLENLDAHEAEVIRIVISGDHQAFEWIVKKYKNSVATICLNMLKDQHLAEEVGQETFIRLFKSLDKFKGHSALKTYIGRIAMNLCLNKIKQRKNRQSRFVGNEDHMAHLPSSSNPSKQIENKELVSMGLAKLDGRSRSLVVLRMVEGYSVKETAEILSIKDGTVMSGLKRALDQLRTALIELGYE